MQGIGIQNCHIIVLCSVAVLVSCRTRSATGLFRDDSKVQLIKPYMDFCDRSSSAEPIQFKNESGNVEFWSRLEIESKVEYWLDVIKGIADVKVKDHFSSREQDLESTLRVSSVLGAYATSYLKLIEMRDKERCKRAGESDMVPDDPLISQINHALADIMTRHLVMSSIACLDRNQVVGGYGFEPESRRWEFCDLFFDIASSGHQKIEYNSLNVALSSAGIYLSSHLAMALSSLPFLDRLWVGTAFEGYGAQLENNPQVRMSRIEFIENNYLDTYEAFNSFLSLNIDTFIDAFSGDYLQENGSSSVVNVLKSNVDIFNAFALMVFKRLREESFENGLGIAKELALDSSVRMQLQNMITALDSSVGYIGSSFHPFLQRKSISNGDYFFEIRENPAFFHESFLDLVHVGRARALAWRLRVDFESFPARVFFRSLGALEYSEGFRNSRATTIPRRSECVGVFLSRLFSGMSAFVDIFQNKEGQLPDTARQFFPRDWKIGFDREKSVFVPLTLRLSSENSELSSCEMYK